VEELIRVLGFQAFRPNILSPAFPSDESRSTDASAPQGLRSYPPCCEEFALSLYRNSEPAFLEQDLPYIIIATEGSVEIRSGKDEICRLDKGQSVFVSASASSVSLHGDGTAYIAGAGRA
jgi:mannose-6-phosphate isomerase class I